MKTTMKTSLAVLALSMTISTGAAFAQTNTAPPKAVPISAPIAVAPISIEINGNAIDAQGFQKYGAEPMIPLRAVTEPLGFSLKWNPDTYAVDLNKNNLFTTVQTGEDRYVINKMYTTLGAAPELLDGKLYVPASFVSKVLHGTVTAEGNTVSIALQDEQKSVQAAGVITAIQKADKYPSIQIGGVGTEGIVLNIGPDTVIEKLDGTKLSVGDLNLGMTVKAEHSIVQTLSLPPQSPAIKIVVQDAKSHADTLGTAGTIEDVRAGEKGEPASVRIKGTNLTDQSQSEIVLNLSEDTAIVNPSGEPVAKSSLVKGAKVIGFYGPVMTKSLPPIGNAWKIVVDVKKD